MNYEFKCPVCGEKLLCTNKLIKCCNNHSFDIAKQGYVNLLMNQQSSKKRHGDDKLMVKARSEFLDKGYYSPLRDALLEEIRTLSIPNMTLVDIGCGECWYTSAIAEMLKENDLGCFVCGIDISKFALMSGLMRCNYLDLAVSSISDLPFCDSSVELALNVFSPHNSSEVYRILKPNGIWITVIPLEEHLMELKEAIYDTPYKNEVDRSVPEGFRLSYEREVKYTLKIDNNEDILNLFMMTPYYYKTSERDQQKVSSLTSLVSVAQFLIRVFVKID